MFLNKLLKGVDTTVNPINLSPSRFYAIFLYIVKIRNDVNTKFNDSIAIEIIINSGISDFEKFRLIQFYYELLKLDANLSQLEYIKGVMEKHPKIKVGIERLPISVKDSWMYSVNQLIFNFCPKCDWRRGIDCVICRPD
ncbi:MAG: hypothetical protein K1X55_17745 [Chitinophagales bacterium]|nr:hypothetical protein [Chitinophagales bacterium]